MKTFTDQQRLQVLRTKALPSDHHKGKGIYVISTRPYKSYYDMQQIVADQSPYDNRHTVSTATICDKTGKYIEVAFDNDRDFFDNMQQPNMRHIIEKADSFLKIIFQSK